MAEDTKIKSVFDLPEFKKYKAQWTTRLKELNLRASYYDGSIYTKNSAIWELGPVIGKEIKPLFLPLARAVDIDAGIIGGDWLFPPVEEEPKSDQWDEARDTLFDWSSWDTKGVLFSHYGAMYGVSGIRVAMDEDDEGQERVILQPARPTCFMLVYSGKYSSKPALGFWIETQKDENGEDFEYAEVITPEKIHTYKAGQPYAYGEDGKNVFTNELGQIPIVEVLHIDDGTDHGECTYQKSILLLNELNRTATQLSQAIRDSVDPQAVIAGAEPTDLTRGGAYMWFIPQDATAQFVTPQVDIPGVLSFIKEIKEGVKESLPELLFDEMRKMGQVATPTLLIFCQELVIKIERVRPNYDRGLVNAMKMAGKLSPELSALDDPELIFNPDRPILPQTPEEKITLRMQEIELEQLEAGASSREGVTD